MNIPAPRDFACSRDRRRVIVGGLVATAMCCAFPFARAAAWQPRRPITLLNPLPAGGSLDEQLRFIAQRLEQVLGQPVVLEAKPGAGTTLAGALVAHAKPDGHTLAVVLVNSLRYPHYQKTSWDPLRDFDYICGLGSFALGILTRSNSQWRTIEDLVQEGRRSPGRLNCGTAGNGGSGHLLLLQIEQATGARFTHVPYKGGPESLLALQSGDIEFIIEGGNQMALAETGALSALAIASTARSKRLPNVPTLRERGIAVAAEPSTYGLIGPAGLPKEAIATLAEAVLGITSEAGFISILDSQYAERWPLGPTEYRAWAAKYFVDIKPVLVRLNLSKP